MKKNNFGIYYFAITANNKREMVFLTMGYSRIIEQDWKKAKKQDTIQSYCLFLHQHFDDEDYSALAFEEIDAINDKIRWKNVQDENTIWGYCHYLHNFPNGQFVEDAHKAIALIEEDDKWDEAVKRKSIRAMVEFVSLYPDGKHLKEAEAQIDQMEQSQQEYQDFNKAKHERTVEALTDFLKKYPNGLFKDEALKEVSFLTIINERLKKKTNASCQTDYEDLEWDKVKTKNTLDAYGEFYKKYPTGKYHDEALKKIEEQEQLLLNKEMQKREIIMWENIKKSRNTELCKDYLKKYPKGEYQHDVKKILYQRNGMTSTNQTNKPLSNKPKTKYLLVAISVVIITTVITLQFYIDEDIIKLLVLLLGLFVLMYLINRIFFENTDDF